MAGGKRPFGFTVLLGQSPVGLEKSPVGLEMRPGGLEGRQGGWEQRRTTATSRQREEPSRLELARGSDGG